MNQFQRDTVKTLIPGFKTESYRGKHTRDLSTLHLEPGKYITERRDGFTVPSFDDLLRGLVNLPCGLDARGLTECLKWYLSVRDTFTPALEFNVLHVQALVRALRVPLRKYGPQNLDCNALREWRDRGRFQERKVVVRAARSAPPPPTTTTERKRGENEGKRSRLFLNLDSQDVGLDVQVQMRHVLTFPFFALHSVIGEALRLGISKAERRLKEREGAMDVKGLGEKAAADTMDEVNQQATTQREPLTRNTQPTIQTQDAFRIPNRPLTTENLRTLPPVPRKSAIATTGSAVPVTVRVPTEMRHTQLIPVLGYPFSFPFFSSSSPQGHGHQVPTPASLHAPDAVQAPRQYMEHMPSDQYVGPVPTPTLGPSPTYTTFPNGAYARRSMDHYVPDPVSAPAPAHLSSSSALHEGYARRPHGYEPHRYESHHSLYQYSRDDE